MKRSAPLPVAEPSEPPELRELPRVVRDVADALDADLFLFSAPLVRDTVDAFVKLTLDAVATPRENCGVFLSTYGGDPDAAYRLARILQRRYEVFTLFVLGPCKSAGTLIALGADAVVMSDDGELGPLDIQVYRQDEIGQRSSGLDIFKALDIVSQQAFVIFERQFLGIIDRSVGNITTKTAAEIARHMATQLLSPITAQVDPYRLGEVQRAIDITRSYGARLGASDATLARLIHGYPSHGFVIDVGEARQLFPGVRVLTDGEAALERGLRALTERRSGFDCLAVPHERGHFGCLNPLADVVAESQDDAPSDPPPPDDASDLASDPAPDEPSEADEPRSGGGGVPAPSVRGGGPDGAGVPAPKRGGAQRRARRVVPDPADEPVREAEPGLNGASPLFTMP